MLQVRCIRSYCPYCFSNYLQWTLTSYL